MRELFRHRLQDLAVDLVYKHGKTVDMDKVLQSVMREHIPFWSVEGAMRSQMGEFLEKNFDISVAPKKKSALETAIGG